MFTTFCIWDIPALIVFLIVVVMFVAHQIKHKNRMDDYQTKLDELTQAEAEDLKFNFDSAVVNAVNKSES